jgi:hypothetical protein
LECNSLGEAGEPQGDITPWKEIYFPYDPKLKDRKNLTKVPVEQSLDFTRQEVLETYTYDIQGMIRVEIENRTGGYRKDFTLRENR